MRKATCLGADPPWDWASPPPANWALYHHLCVCLPATVAPQPGARLAALLMMLFIAAVCVLL